MTSQELLQLISNPELIDYASLKKEEALRQFPELLDQLLDEAKKSFEELLEMPDEEISYTTFMEPFLVSDEDLSNLFKAVDSFNSTHSSIATRKIIGDFQPKLVDYQNKVSLNPELYKKLKHLEETNLSEDEKRSVQLVIRDLEVAGVHLPEEKREELKKINKELSDLSEAFSNNVIDSKAEFFYEIETDESLKEMPEEDLEMAREEAKKRNSNAEFVFTLSPPSHLAIMRYCANESIREIFHKRSNTVATKDNHNNRPLALRILKLREQKAKLMGFENFAQYILQERMAPNPQKVMETLEQVRQVAGKEALKNVEELKEYSGKADFKEWDISFYAEKLKKEKFHVDDKLLKPYFVFENVMSGLFGMVKTLFEVEMKPVNIKPYAEGAKAYEVYHQGELISYYFLDPFARPEKRPGAWANDIRSGYKRADGTKKLPIVINVCNFPKPTNGKPSLLTHRDVETIFHEFGHAIHVMLSSSQNLPNLSGFHTEWDFVEAPSQILENWTWEYEVLSLFAKHYQTNELISKELVDKLRASQNFMSGLFLIRQNEFGSLDYMMHTKPTPETVEALDEVCHTFYKEHALIPKFEGYSMYTAFTHIFAGGYCAGYYSYVWAEIMEADMYEKAKQLGILSPEFGKKYVEEILAPGAKKTAMELFVNFMGAEPYINALFKKHGIAV